MFDGSDDWNLRLILDNAEFLPGIYAKLALIQADTAYANCLKMYELGLMDAEELEKRGQIYINQYKQVEKFNEDSK
ncbi:MAG: hypothetical protein BZ133_05565 [Methanosphaera sp. SHI613]|jgi:hypothetical protein|nr:MAG: hypothetical protein BZ133_05565 [Methanosphaera sp. SHI613]